MRAAPDTFPRTGLRAGLVLAAALAVAPPAVTPAAGAAGQAAGQAEADTLALPRARTAPTLDCAVGEWSAGGRISLSDDRPEVLTARGVGDPADVTARVHLSWTRDTLYVMADVRDDRVRPGGVAGGDWVRVEVGSTPVWVPAPDGTGTRATVGPRSTGDSVPSSVCPTGYGWLGEVAVPADRLGEEPRPGDRIGLEVLVEDPDGEGEDADPPYLRWADTAVLAAAPRPAGARADSLLGRLRREVTMEELRGRPGARDTSLVVEGDTVPAVRVDVAGVPTVAFPDPRAGGAVTYWLEGGEGSAAEALGFHRTVAALHRRLGQLQAAEARDRSIFPEVRFELLPGVVFRLGDPGAEDGEVSRSALPTGVYVRSGGGG